MAAACAALFIGLHMAGQKAQAERAAREEAASKQTAQAAAQAYQRGREDQQRQCTDNCLLGWHKPAPGK
jgi:hypothetical protein